MEKRSDERKRMINSFIKLTRLGLSSPRVDPFDAYARIKGSSRNMKEAREILAAYDTVRFLRRTGNIESLRAVYAVYFSLPRKGPRKSEISGRILRFAYENNCDERTVYRRLSYVLKVYNILLD